MIEVHSQHLLTIFFRLPTKFGKNVVAGQDGVARQKELVKQTKCIADL